MDLDVVDRATQRSMRCRVVTRQSPQSCHVEVHLPGDAVLAGDGEDFEEALHELRTLLEGRGLHLLCNRFRRDAFVTPLSRQMSNGLRCYLVQHKRPLGPEHLVDCLAPAPAPEVSSSAEADRYIARWRARPPIIATLLAMLRDRRR